MKRGVRKLRSFFPRRRLQQAAAFAVTLGACSYVLWYLLPSWLAAFIVTTAVAHEFAHYITARIKKLPVKLPVFLLGIYLMVGATQVMDGGRKDATIALIGPIVGMLTALALGVGSFITGFMPGVWASGWIFVFQLWSGTFGSDGKAYKKARMADELEANTGPVAVVIPVMAS